MKVTPRLAWSCALASALIACGAATSGPQQVDALATRRPGAAAQPSAASHGADRGTSRDSSALDPALAADVAEYLRFFPGYWPEPGRAAAPRPEGVRAPRPFPTKARPPRAAKVRAYAWLDAAACVTRSPLGPPFERDGSLCPGVIGAIELTSAEAEVVQELAIRRDEQLRENGSHAIVRCDFTPHHAFVYLDASGAPIAIVEPCFDCHQWRIRPSSRPDLMNDYEPPAMTDAERKALAAILDGHGLGAWTREGDSARVARVRDHIKRTYGALTMESGARDKALTEAGRRRQAALLAAPPNVDRDVSLKAASEHDVHQLCAWYGEQFRANGQHFGSHGFECESGLQYATTVDDIPCAKAARKCSTPVRAIEECLRAVARGPDELCSRGFPAACGPQQECAVGVKVHKRPGN